MGSQKPFTSPVPLYCGSSMFIVSDLTPFEMSKEIIYIKYCPTGGRRHVPGIKLELRLFGLFVIYYSTRTLSTDYFVSFDTLTYRLVQFLNN